MSKQTVNQVIQRAIGDAAFRRQLQRDPSSALAGFDLTKDERAAITSGDPTRLTALGVDQRMSKAFGLGAMSEVSQTVIGDTSSAGSAAFIDEGTTAGTSAIVTPETAEGGSAVLVDSEGFLPSVNVGDPQAAASAAIDVTAPTHLQTVEADLDSPDMRTLSDASPAGTSHLQTVEADLDSPDMRTVSDASAAGPTAFIDVGDGSAGGTTAFEPDTTDYLPVINTGTPGAGQAAIDPGDLSGDANVLDPGLVGGGQAAIDPGDLTGDASVLDEASGGLDSGGDIRPTEY